MRYQGVGMLAVVFGVAASGGAPVVTAAQDTTQRPYLLEQIGDAKELLQSAIELEPSG